MRVWKILLASLLIVSVGAGMALAARFQNQQVSLAGAAIPQFVNQLPLLSVAGGPMQTVYGNQAMKIHMCEFKVNMLPAGAVAGYTGTWVWGYLPEADGQTTCNDLVDLYDDGDPDNSSRDPLGTYIGPVVLNERGSSTDITFINDLGTVAGTNLLAWKSSTDQTMHWADPLNDEGNACNHAIEEWMLPAGECGYNYGWDGNDWTNAPIPAVVHLHGGEVPPVLDGGPDAWFTNDANRRGHGYYSFTGAGANEAIYKYPNTQEAAPIWFHDHVLGITRLNVYAGLAGAYLISDPDQTLPGGLHPYGLSYGTAGEPPTPTLDVVTVPLVIQDRMFDTNGQLFFQANSNGGLLWATNPEHPYWSPEFIGDTIVVNGKVWPNLDVEPKRYRFLFINGSNARSYEMFLIDPLKIAVPPRMWVIATDGGYLDAPVMAKKLTMMPGERYGVIIDFAGLAEGTKLVLKNTAKTPFPGGGAPQGATTGQIMQFTVVNCDSVKCGASDTSFNPATAATIRAAGQKIVRLPGTPGGAAISASTVQQTRTLTLNEVMGMPPPNVLDPILQIPYPGGPLEVLVNNTKWAGESPRNDVNSGYEDFMKITKNGIDTYYSELPKEGETEVWEIVNITADAHPIHLHLVQFQIIDRQALDAGKYTADYDMAFPDVTALSQDPMWANCIGGVFCPGFGPPLKYDGSNLKSGNKLGGNIDPYTMVKGKFLYMKGKPAPPDPNEQGWKDTVIAYPGQVTRLAVRWAPTDLLATTAASAAWFPFDPNGGHGYVWHCHIIDHEDNEMMRPTSVVVNNNATRTFVDY